MSAKYPSWERAYVNAYMRKRYATPEGKAYAHQQYLKHREKIRARSKTYYLRTKSKVIARAKAWREKNHEHAKALKRERYAKAHEHYIAKSRAYSRVRTATGKAQAYRQKMKERHRAWSRARSANAGDDYAREQLSKYSPCSAREWPQELVEAKKIQIQLKRLLKSP